MARMRPGTHTSVTDIHYEGIRVGDVVRDASGRTYVIDGYGRAKPDEGGGAVPLRDLDRPEIISPAAPPKLREVGGRVVPAGTASPPYEEIPAKAGAGARAGTGPRTLRPHGAGSRARRAAGPLPGERRDARGGTAAPRLGGAGRQTPLNR